MKTNSVKRQAMLDRAKEHIQANISNPFDLESLACATGANRRTLQREFLSAYGMSPHKWARCVMLLTVRKRIRMNHAKKLTVEAIAYECGFRHMGRFSKYYLQLFGEHPSQTLSKQSSENQELSAGAAPSTKYQRNAHARERER